MSDRRHQPEHYPEHYSVELHENDEGWVPGRCSCGYEAGMFPTAEDACDALMEHVYIAARLESQEARSA